MQLILIQCLKIGNCDEFSPHGKSRTNCRAFHNIKIILTLEVNFITFIDKNLGEELLVLAMTSLSVKAFRIFGGSMTSGQTSNKT